MNRSIVAPQARRRVLKADGTSHMVVGSLVTAAAAFAFQALGGRALGPDGFAPISALWTTLFIAISVVLVPLEQFVTREASLGIDVLGRRRSAIAVAGLFAAVMGAAFVYITLPTLFDGQPVYVVQMFLLTVAYTAFLVTKGILVGRRRFTTVGWLLAGEGLVRLGAGVLVIALVSSAPNLVWAMTIAPLAALLLLRGSLKDGRRAERPARMAAARQFLGPYILGSGASQVLLAGAPLAVVLIGGTTIDVSVLFVTFTLFRAPLTLIYSLQGRLLPSLIQRSGSGDQGRLRRLSTQAALGGVIAGGLSAGVGWLLGPFVVSLLFGAPFAPSRAVAALAAAGVVAASTAQVVGQVVVARGRTALLAAAWTVGLAVAVAVLATAPGRPDVVVAAAFVAGEGTAVVLVALFASSTNRRASRADGLGRNLS